MLLVLPMQWSIHVHLPFPHPRRLKSAQGNKTISALLSLNCPRRILLTGTPIQNNLQVGRAAAGAAGTPDGLVVHLRPSSSVFALRPP